MLSVKGTEEEAVINELAIRSMAKAVYSTHNIGHYGLGFRYYTHFTSPIRRYSDLMVHRLLFQYLKKKGNFKYSNEELEEISDHLSITERNAVEAERKSVKLKQIEYLKNHIGEEFHAIISGVTYFGIFVKITDILAEGLVKIRDLESDSYVYDEKKYALVGKSTKKQYRLGDKVSVKLIRVDIEKSEVDFIILE
jgi:ribonuclease R